MRYSITTIAGPAFVPVSVSDAKSHLRVFHSQDDAQISDFIIAAINRAQHRTARQIAAAQFRLSMSCFPGRAIRLPINPVISVESLVYLDSTGTFQTIPATDYRVISDSEPAIVWNYDPNWPTVGDSPDAVQVEFTAGYMAQPSSATFPGELRVGILQAVWHMYDNRGEVSTDGISAIPHSAESIFESFGYGDEFEQYGGYDYEPQYGGVLV